MPGLADHLLSLGDADLAAYFEGTDAAEVTEQIRSAAEDDLVRILVDDRVRAEAVSAILTRFPEFADPDRLTALDGVVCFDLARHSGPNERHTVRFACSKVEIVAPGTEIGVTIGANILDFVRLVTGQRDAALLYLADELQISGDEMLALAVGSVFHVPGTGEAAFDPAALDPVDVATAVARTSAKHMREVMASGFRSIVLDEVIRRFPEFLIEEKARDTTLCIGFRIGGRRDGEVDRFVVTVDHGTVHVDRDAEKGSRRDATISVDGVDFLKLVTGQLNPVKGVLTGALKVRGEKSKALALSAIMAPPHPRGRN